MRLARYRVGVLVLAACWLTACGGPVFVRNETAKFVEAGSKVANEATAFYALVVQSDSDFYATVVATAPTCPVPNLLAKEETQQYPSIKLYGPQGIAELYEASNLDIAKQMACDDYRTELSQQRDATLKKPEPWIQLEDRYRALRAPLCLPAAAITCLAKLPDEQRRFAFLEVTPAPRGVENFKVELDTIKAMSEYLEALGKLAADPNSRVDDHLGKAVEKLEAVQGYFDAKWVTDEIKKQQGAVGGLLATIKQLHDSAKHAGQIREKLKSKGPEISAALENLADRSDRTYRQEYLQSVSLRVTRLQNYLEMQTAGQSLADRQIAMTQYQKDALILRNAEQSKSTAEPNTPSPTGTALRGVIDAQKELIEAIDNPNAEQRAQIAALSLKNFTTVLKGLYGVLGAFGVL